MGNHESAAFSLVELMVAIAITGLVIALSVPGVGKFLQNWRLRGEADQMATALRTARSSAIMKNINAVFEFDVGTQSYQYFEDVDGDGVRDSGEYRSSRFEFPAGIQIDEHTMPDTKITFGPKGNTLASGTITLRNRNLNSRTVRVFGGTGNIQVD